jgi:hypothetical protein
MVDGLTRSQMQRQQLEDMALENKLLLQVIFAFARFSLA